MSEILPPLRIGLAGLGTVGGGVVALLKDNAEVIAARTGCEFVITAASARHASKCPKGVRYVEDARQLANADDVDVVVEAIGGADGVAFELVQAALAAGKPVVTANKAMLARHGLALAKLSEAHHATLRFEAAVAGAIPVIHALREGLSANKVKRVRGIVNGSTNFILSAMAKSSRAYEDVEAEAKKLGYLEADPSLDVDGHDAAQKLSLMAAIAFSMAPNEPKVARKGIRSITIAHMREAEEMGYVLKLIAEAVETPQGIVQTVEPMLVPKSSPISLVDGSVNIVIVDTVPGGRFVFTGEGAGSGPTASSVVADLVAIARGSHVPVFGVPTINLNPPEKAISAPEKQLHSAELPYPVFSVQ